MYKVYQVLEGDTLEKIARKLNIELDDLLGINGLNKNSNITPGMFLVIPAKKSNFTTYTVQKGDNLYKIAQKYGISLNDLVQLNGLKENEYIYPGTELTVPTSDIVIYITKDGDTLTTVSDNFKTNKGEIISQNDNIYLQPNQLLIYKKD